MSYVYGEEIDYEKSLLEQEDKESLQNFSCGNIKLDKIIHQELINDYGVDESDGLIFKVVDNKTSEIIAIVSLASSGIIHEETNYSKLLPAVKIDIFAVDVKYQKMHYNKMSEEAENPEDHFYFSDSIMCSFLEHCYEITEKYALVQYVTLYADKKAYRFYERNGFSDFKSFMKEEHNQEINKNIPMYLKL